MTATCFKKRDHHLPIKVRWVVRASVPQRIRRCRCCRARLRIILPHHRRNDLHNRTVIQIIKFPELSDNSDCCIHEKSRRNIILYDCNTTVTCCASIYSVTVRTRKSGIPPTSRRKIKKKKTVRVAQHDAAFTRQVDVCSDRRSRRSLVGWRR